MRRRLPAPGDMVSRALDHLCQDVQSGIVAVPTPDSLTRALEGLFPKEKLMPIESRFALHTIRSVTWYVEEETAKDPEDFGKMLWLRRRLSRYM